MSTPNDSSTPALVVTDLRRSFGDLRAVDGISFSIAPGETFGLLGPNGPNGAGKTTAISMICGLLEPDSGSVTVCGDAIRVGSTRGRSNIGYVPQELALYPDMTGRDNLKFFARLYGIRGAAATKRMDEVLDIVALRDRADDRVEEYSGGMQRRLNIAAGMLHEPSVLILDEPTVGIDPQSRNAILDAVAELGSRGLSVLYTTHHIEEAERLCSRVAIMDHGKVLAEGTQRELVAMLLGVSSRSSQQVSGIALLLGLVLAALGGSMQPLQFFPDTLRTVAFATTPHAWMNDAMWRILVDGAGLGDIIGALSVLVGIGVVVTGLAVVALRRSMA